ncbi:MAG: hypothetical protein RJA63_2643 [Pseudomonadota bacterium]|jgi:hypothetical protein
MACVPNELGLVPIVVGVTGHRDLLAEDESRLTDSVRRALLSIQDDYPNSPCILLSALAQGADRLVAHVALSIGWEVGAVLPFPPDNYEADFDSEESVLEFRALLSRAAWTTVADAAPSELKGRSARDAAYRAAGIKIGQQSQVLLAIWDGNPEKKPGGTADVVAMFLDGVPWPLLGAEAISVPDTGVVWWMAARRKGSPDSVSVDQIGALKMLEPRPAGLPSQGEIARWNTILRCVDQFNADARFAMQTNTPQIASRLGLLGGEVEGANSAARQAGHLFAIADYMSTEAQEKRSRMFLKMIGVATLAVFFEQLYSGPFFELVWLVATLFAGAVGYGLYRSHGAQRLESRYLDYRALAEACRTQYYWKIANLEHCAAQPFLRGQRDELEWIRRAVLTTELGLNSSPLSEVAQKGRLLYVANHWVADQQHYFVGMEGSAGGNKARFNESAAAGWTKHARRFFVCGVAVMGFLALMHGAFNPKPDEALSNWLQYLIVLYGMLFAAAGLALAYSETKAHTEHARRYRRLGLSMALANKQLRLALNDDDFAAAGGVITLLGQESLSECSDWILLHRDRPVSVPIG